LEQPLGYLNYLNPDIFHINLYHVAAMATLFSGFTLALLLAFAKREGQTANLFLGAALAVIVLKTGGLSPIFLPALGPLLYFYVRRMTSSKLQFGRKDVLHFCPLLVAYWMPGWLVLISVVIYLYLSHRLIQHFYIRLQPVLMDRPRFAFRRLDKALHLLGLLFMLWLFNDAWSFTVAFVLIGVAAEVMLKLDSSTQLATPITDRYDAKEKSRRLKEAVAANRFYEDAELTLTSLAVKLNIHPHDLSRIINVGMEKNFSDFINEFRVRETARKMQDPAHDRLTLLGIAYESGFNSQRTFNRVFKEMTGKTPVEYKNGLKKELPNDKLAILSHLPSVILRSGSPPGWAPVKLNRNYMFKNYFKIAFRNLWRNKVFSAINIGGVALGLAVCLLITLFVTDELSYDTYNVNANRIYRVNSDFKFAGGVFNDRLSPAPMATVIMKEYPQIEQAVRLREIGRTLVKKGDETIAEPQSYYADANLFNVFTLPMVAGDPKTALVEPHSLVVSEYIAEKYFGISNSYRDVIGKTLRLDDADDYKITGVIKNTPAQSHIHFNLLRSMPAFANQYPLWTSENYMTYLLARKSVSRQDIDSYLNQLAKKYAEPELEKRLHSSFADLEKKSGHFRFVTIPLTKIHLYSSLPDEIEPSGNIQYVYIFIVIGFFILLIACVNFMNLSTARSAGRSKEVGVRKVLGSSRLTLIYQFLTESTLTGFIALLLAFVLAALLFPYFNRLSGKQMTLNLFATPWILPCLLIITIVIGVLAGIYPAFFLSAFKPVNALKGKLSAGFKGSLLRNSLVVFQFATVIILIIGSLVVYSQLNYIRNKKLGYNRGQVLIVKNIYSIYPHDESFRQDVLKLAGVKSGTNSPYLPTFINHSKNVYSKDGSLGGNQSDILGTWYVDADYIPTLGMQMADGRNFSRGILTDSSAVMINETAARLLGFKKPLNKNLYLVNDKTTELHIVGVVKDFNTGSLRNKIEPLVFRFNSLNFDNGGAMAFKIETKNIPGLLSQIETLYHAAGSNTAGLPFDYSFMDSDFNSLYKSEQNTGKIFVSFAVFAILIACLGLFGLVTYAAEQRTKEIGIRKVLGASVRSIAAMLTNDFLKLVGISAIIAFPVAWYAMNRWLQDFAYRTAISWWIFAAALVLALLITIVTVSYQSIKAALTNPIKSLRSE
jgi:putative ABC transport system permease protein